MKTIVTAIMLLAFGVFAQIPGTIPLSGPIAPYSVTNTYPTHISKYGKGGFVTVANTAERDAFPAERREAGMMIAVAGGGTFQLGPDLTNWSETLTVDARNFGAVPNSPISRQDSSGSSASAGIQAAIDYVSSRGGGVVKVPAGSWMISTPVNVKPRVRLVGEGTGYTQAYETNSLYLSGATRFYPAPGSTQDMVIARGSDASGLSAPVTVFTSGDLSLNTNYNHGGAIVGISFDSGYTGLRGRSIHLEGLMGFTIDDVAFAPYGAYYPISVWACNGVHIHGVKGLTRFPIMIAYSADCTVDDCFVGGNYGPTLWIKGAKAVVTGNKFFNSQAQGNSIRPTFTVNATTDTITVSDSNVGKQWFDTFPLTVELVSGTLPGNLATNTIYYAVRVAGSDTDFKVHTRRERNAGGTGGAAQGNFIDIADAGSGTFNIGPGPVFNLLVDQYDQGTFVGNQLDQSYGDGLGLWSAYNNSFVGNAITEHGWNAASSDYSAVRLMGQSLNNQFIGNIIGNRSSSSHGSYGLTADAGSTNNMWYGQLTGVTNIFGANPNVWFAQRWNYATKRLEVYNSGWRTVATLDPGVQGVEYVSPGWMEMVSPANGLPAARFTSKASIETVNLVSYAEAVGQGAGLSSYAARGTPGAPSQLLAGDELFEWLSTAYGTNGWVYSIASIGGLAAGPVLPGNAPTRLFGATTSTNSATRAVRWITYENGATVFGNGGLSFASGPPAGTALQVSSTTGLMVPPVMTTTERDAISSPPTFGLLGNSTSGQLEWWTGTGYTNLGAGGGGGGGSGTVTSIGLSAPSWLTVGGSPVTTSGTLSLTATSQTSNTFLAGPVSGAASASAFRALHANDLWAITNLVMDSLTVSNTLTAGSLVIQTNRANEGVFTNGLTLNGSRITSWPSGGTNASAVNVDGSTVNSPNFTGTSEITNTVSGTNISMALRVSGVTAGSYTNPIITVDSKGRLSAASSGATPGTVSSVALSAPSWITVGGSPVTTSGTLALTSTAQTSNTFLAGPTSGAASASAFRALSANDLWAITNLNIDTLTTSNLSAQTLTIQTNRSNEGVFTNGITLNGSRITNWSSGSGDVVGPSSATDNALVRFDSTTGKLIQNSSATLSDTGTLSVSNLTVSGTGSGSVTISDATGTNGWTIASPSSVTSTPRLTLPAAASNGIMVVTNSGTNMFAQFVAHPGANGKVLIATNTPAQGFFFGDPPSSGGGSTNALAIPGGNGVVIHTGTGAATNRTITGTAWGVTVTNGDGVSGNPTFDVDRTASPGSDPALPAGWAAFGSVGIVFEGNSANLLEGTLNWPLISSADKAIDLPDASGTIVLKDTVDILSNKTITNALLTGTTSIETFNSGTGTVTNMNVGSINGHWHYDSANGDNWQDGQNAAVSAAVAFVGWASSGIGTAAAYITNSTPKHPFVVVIPSTASANDGVRFHTHSGFQTAYAETGSGWEFIVKAYATNGLYARMGFLDQAGTTIPTDGAYVSITNNQVYAVGRSNSTTYIGSTPYSIPTDTWLKFRGICTSSNTMAFSAIDDSGSVTWSDTVTGLPNVPGREYGHGIVAYNTNGSAVNLIAIDAMGVKWGVR